MLKIGLPKTEHMFYNRFNLHFKDVMTICNLPVSKFDQPYKQPTRKTN